MLALTPEQTRRAWRFARVALTVVMIASVLPMLFMSTDPMKLMPPLPTGAVLYAVLAGVLFISAVPVLAMVFPAEPFLIGAILVAGRGDASLGVLLAIAVVATVSGDVLSYWLGRQFGAKLLQLRVSRRCRGIVNNIKIGTHRSMLIMTLVHRWMPPSRGLMHATIGAYRRPFNQFVLCATVAAIAWSAVLTVAIKFGGPRLVMAAPLLVVGVLLARRCGAGVIRRRNDRTDATNQAGCPSTPSVTPT